jgi:hypothetical protein
MRTHSLLALLALAGATAGCQERITEPIPEEERVVFEIEYINHAWTPTYFGYVIYGSGEIFRYDRSGIDWAFQDSASYTLDMIEDKFQPVKTQVGMRDPGEISDLSAKINAAARGPYSDSKQECADAGLLTYRAYQYIEAEGRFQPILLRVEGDFAWENVSDQAQDLIAFIRSLELMEEPIGCDP